MADGITIELKGLKEVEDRLILLGAVAGAKVVQQTLFKAAKPIYDQAIANIAAIPTGSGALAKATRRVSLRREALTGSGTRFSLAVSPKTKNPVAIALANRYYKRKKPIRGIFWGHLVEWGFTPRGGGRVPGRQVFTRAFNSRGAQTVAIFAKEIGLAVERAIKKLQP